MNHPFFKTSLILWLLIAGIFVARGQLTPVQLIPFITENKYLQLANLKYPEEIKAFYTRLNFKPAWIQPLNASTTGTLIKHLHQSAQKGLDETDYQYAFLEVYQKGKYRFTSMSDSLEAEVRIADAAIHYYSDIAFGNLTPEFRYNGLRYTPDCREIPLLIADCISTNSLQLLPNRLSPAFPEITAFENKINGLLSILNDSAFKEVVITNSKINDKNIPLITKLYQLQIPGIGTTNITDTGILKKAVKEAQLQFNMVADGILRASVLKELNIPVAVRLQQLNVAINYYRWLFCLTQNKSVIVVNIPAAYMKVYRSNEIILEMRMIVGKKTTTTPTLTSKVEEVILYPYWHVPYSIATKELLPRIKRNPAYIDENNYQVLNKAGKIINPYNVNWHALSRTYFPYIIRQSTGCDNALGLIKLNFYNPLGVYLHDTPTKNLFSANSRYFSHGCMRMDKPMELGHLILKNNKIAIDTLEQKGCLLNIAPITVKADEKMPVVVWYNPAGTDSTGRIVFFEDVYGRFNWKTKQQ